MTMQVLLEGKILVAQTEAWFYRKDSQRIGPVSLDQLCDLFRNKALDLQTEVFNKAFGEWTPASSIPGLRALCPATAQEPLWQGPTQALDYETPIQSDVAGIGGWLILPAIGMILGPLIQALATVGLWLLSGLPAAQRIAGSLKILAFISGAFLLYRLYTAVLFFSKKRSAPAAVIGVYIGGILFDVAGGAMFQSGNAKSSASSTPWVSPWPWTIGTAVWILYFLRSERVRATFVR